METTPKKAIVLLNMGGPDSLKAVKPFLYNLFADRDLIQLPAGALLQKPFARLISQVRSRKVSLNYSLIGGKTPLLDWTCRQARGIADALGEDFAPYVAMRYWHPRSDEVVRRMAADGVTEAVVLSMYPHYTGATTGSSVKDFRRAAAEHFPRLRFHVIEQWYDWAGYLDSLASRVREGLERYHEMVRDEVQILFSAHALPQKFIDRGDPYLEHVMETVKGVMERVGPFGWHLGFQSRSGPVKWMEPDTLDVIDRLGRQGRRNVLIVPISFVSDHIETLVEIDQEMAAHARGAGIDMFLRCPSLNDSPDFLEAMATLVRRELEILG